MLAFPDRCTSFRTAISTIRVLFGCLLFRTAAGLSGPQWLQLEYFLGASFSGPLQVFRTTMATIRVRFGCLLFRTAACLSDRNGYNTSTFWVLAFPDRCRSFWTTMSTIRVHFGCLLFRTAARLFGPRYLQLEYFLGASFSGPLQVFPDHNVYN